MYITVKSMNKTLGKYIEYNDLFIGVPLLLIFMILFSFTAFKLESFIFLTISIFLMLPIELSKKNRMYKVIGLVIIYLFKTKKFYFYKWHFKYSRKIK